MPERDSAARGFGRRLRLIPRKIGYGYGPRLMSTLRRWWVLLRHPYCEIRFGRDCYLGPGFSLHMPEPATFIAGDGVEFRRNFRAEVAAGARVAIGGGTRFTYDALIQCGRSITIGKRCWIGQATIIVDGDHRFRDPEVPVEQQGFDVEPVVIGDEAMIYSKATVVGVRVGRRGVLASNAVVIDDVEPFTMVGGIPAREIDRFGP